MPSSPSPAVIGATAPASIRLHGCAPLEPSGQDGADFVDTRRAAPTGAPGVEVRAGATA
ncbi:hypothetical protein [Streptomyces sp. ML-6]|uniref:hypothetical protein n=1 Tax=Streptomyces sp. ML-6 TaxID=2982693 RepID=UPI0024BF6038|nr:hypothetical protein [Streptomyces sp. ML-6]MDK0524239.1 hypothetical protein [Streptomyces sp. ML-6]